MAKTILLQRLATLALAAACGAGGMAQDLKYVFMFIGDGMGMAQVDGTEMFLAARDSVIGARPLCFTRFPVATMVTTYSASNSVTDSAAGGTALACGEKTANGIIGMAADGGTPLTSIAAQAKGHGCRVGIVTSVSIDHATPAAFYANQPDRDMYYEIACQLPASGFDFFGGSGFLDPDGSGSGDDDATPVATLLDEAGYTVCLGMDEYRASDAGDKVIVLSDDPTAKSLTSAIDRRHGDMTLRQLTEAAVETLAGDSDDPFFLMVEGGKIDWSCHSNDAGAVFHEVLDLDSAVMVAYDFYLRHPDETAIIVTADHETGGLAIGNEGYTLALRHLASQRLSVEELSARLNAMNGSRRQTPAWDEIKDFLRTNLGFWQTVELTADEEAALRKEYEAMFVAHNAASEASLYSTNARFAATAIGILDAKAHISWASGDHSAGYVPLFAIGRGTEAMTHKLDNTDIPRILARLAGYDE